MKVTVLVLFFVLCWEHGSAQDFFLSQECKTNDLQKELDQIFKRKNVGIPLLSEGPLLPSRPNFYRSRWSRSQIPYRTLTKVFLNESGRAKIDTSLLKEIQDLNNVDVQVLSGFRPWSYRDPFPKEKKLEDQGFFKSIEEARVNLSPNPSLKPFLVPKAQDELTAEFANSSEFSRWIERGPEKVLLLKDYVAKRIIFREVFRFLIRKYEQDMGLLRLSDYREIEKKEAQKYEAQPSAENLLSYRRSQLATLSRTFGEEVDLSFFLFAFSNPLAMSYADLREEQTILTYQISKILHYVQSQRTEMANLRKSFRAKSRLERKPLIAALESLEDEMDYFEDQVLQIQSELKAYMR